MVGIILFYAIGLVLIFSIVYSNSKSVEKEIVNLEQVKSQIVYKKTNVKCSNWGSRGSRFLFPKADLYFLKDAFVIIGYGNIGKYKFYKSILILSDEEKFYRKIFSSATITVPKKINLNSIANDVFLKFGEFGFGKEWAEIRLKNLTEEEKKLISLKK